MPSSPAQPGDQMARALTTPPAPLPSLLIWFFLLLHGTETEDSLTTVLS